MIKPVHQIKKKPTVAALKRIYEYLWLCLGEQLVNAPVGGKIMHIKSIFSNDGNVHTGAQNTNKAKPLVLCKLLHQYIKTLFF